MGRFMKVLNLIIKNKYCIILSISSFILGIVFGELINISLDDSDQPLSKENNVRGNISNFNNFISILINNLKSTFILVLGFLSFGITTFIGLFINGICNSIPLSDFDTQSFLYIVPHGIFEIPAMFIAGAAGFKIPYEITLYLLDKKEKPITGEDIKEFLKLAFISIFLIVIAAYVEVYITPKIANILLKLIR